MANLLDVPFDDFLRSAKLRGQQSGLRSQRDSGIKPELRFPIRVRDANVNALLFAEKKKSRDWPSRDTVGDV